MDNQFDLQPLSIVDHALSVGPFNFNAFDLVGSQTAKLTENELALGASDKPGLLERMKPRTIFDVGANVGIWSLYAKLLHPDATILCVEPVRELYEVLVMNLGRAAGSIGHMHAGIAPAGQAEVMLGWHPHNPGGASFQHANTRNWAVAPAMRLEHVMDELKVDVVDFVKLDVEGMEYPILDDVKDWKRIRAISIEMHQLLSWPSWANTAVYDAAERFLLDVHRTHGVLVEVRRPDKPAFVFGEV